MEYDLSTMSEEDKKALLKKLNAKRLPVLIVGIVGYLFLNVIRSSSGIILPTVIDKYGLTAAQAGLFIAIYNYFYAFVNLPIGGIIDIVKSRRIMLLSYGLMTAGLVAFAFAPNFTWVIITRAVMGLGAAGFFPAYSKAVAAWVSAKAHPTVIGIIMASSTVGMLLSSTPLTLLILGVGMTKAMLVLAVICLAVFGVMLFVIRDDPQSCGFPTEDEIRGNVISKAEAAYKPSFKEIVRVITNPRVLCVICGVLCNNVAAVAGGYAATWMQKGLGFDAVVAANVVMIGTLVGIISPLMTGFVTNKFGAKATQYVFVIGSVATLLLHCLFMESHTPLTVILCNLPSVLGGGMAISSTQTMLRKNVGPKYFGTCVGLYNFVGWCLAQAVYAQIFAGFIDANYSIQSFHKGYWITLVIAVIFGIITLVGSTDKRLKGYDD